MPQPPSFPRRPRKQGAVIAALQQLSEKLGAGARLPRVRELSQSLGVTMVTLNRALKRLEERGIIIRKPRSGIYVSNQISQKTIGLIFGWSFVSPDESRFSSILLNACARRASLRNERISLFLDSQAENQDWEDSFAHHDLVDALAAKKLDGILLAAARGTAQEKWIRRQGIPVVSCNPGDTPYSVMMDTDGLISLAAEALTREGCRSLGLLATLPADVEAFHEAATQLGFGFKESWIFCRGVVPAKNYELTGMDFALNLLHGAKGRAAKRLLPDGLIIANDVMTRSVCSSLRRNGIRIGKDIQIATHANKGSQMLDEWAGQLFHCEIDPEEVAESMLAMLDTLMDGRPIKDKIIKIQPKLSRQSPDPSY